MSPAEAQTRIAELRAQVAHHDELYYRRAKPEITDFDYDRLKAELDENFSGTRNAGRLLLLEGGLDWKQMGLSPTDMGIIEAKASAGSSCWSSSKSRPTV